MEQISIYALSKALYLAPTKDADAANEHIDIFINLALKRWAVDEKQKYDTYIICAQILLALCYVYILFIIIIFTSFFYTISGLTNSLLKES